MDPDQQNIWRSEAGDRKWEMEHLSSIARTSYEHRSKLHGTFIKKYSDNVPLGRMIEPEELIPHVAYLTSSDSKFLTGQNILVDGGRSIW